MKTSEIIQILKKKGWQFEQVHGNHHQFVHPDFPHVITVPPFQTDLKSATVQQIIKDAKLDCPE
ncbi:type II toxin-antitoxin system HicA family toxin [Pantoea ananatis]|uniref:type II toxin-antitoxin system HicA family toxin n=1 Tax=Pantoea ananas TaxID=553 RepID=UPI0024AE52C9|nr:type II toxin-antitoxin system HicA family toxin [Pantoea ananatis]MDI6539585.1 type II toxin-antitoxin system HicA family toxin [Pantoea ananatis]